MAGKKNGTVEAPRLVTRIRKANPSLGRKADYGGNTKTAMKAGVALFCMECLGGSRAAVKRCDTYACPLWPYRPGADGSPRPEGWVPTEKQYSMLCDDGEAKTEKELERDARFKVARKRTFNLADLKKRKKPKQDDT